MKFTLQNKYQKRDVVKFTPPRIHTKLVKIKMHDIREKKKILEG